MPKKILILTFILINFTLITACSKEQPQTDALKFKQEYETLNDQLNSKTNQPYRSITIPEDNPIIYQTASEIVDKIDQQETFVVYFGFASCPWCRSIVPNLLEAATSLGLSQIYYVDVQNIRDTITLDEANQPVTEQEGSTAYYELLEKLDPVLESYTLTTNTNEVIETGEKRIYAPNIVAIIDGVATNLTDGISSKQTSSTMELTADMNSESLDKIKCAIECVVTSKEVCAAKTKC